MCAHSPGTASTGKGEEVHSRDFATQETLQTNHPHYALTSLKEAVLTLQTEADALSLQAEETGPRLSVSD